MTTALKEHLRFQFKVPNLPSVLRNVLDHPILSSVYQTYLLCFESFIFPTMHLGQARAAATAESVQFKERTSKCALENFTRRCRHTLNEQTGSHHENYEPSLHPEVEHNFIRSTPWGAFHRLFLLELAPVSHN